MYKTLQLTDRADIESFLRRDVPLHIYQLGDLDDFFWPYTKWYGLKQNGELTAVALFYTEVDPPVLAALAHDDTIESLGNLIQTIGDELPSRFYAHLSDGLQASLADTYQLTSHGLHTKMVLKDRSALAQIKTSEVQRLIGKDLEDLRRFYDVSYPGSWFNPRMLETGHYLALYQGEEMVSAGGVHVYSPSYKVAAIGNMATHPDYRNRGYARRVTAALCKDLLKTVVDIGLNVRADNVSARACYERLGFCVTDEYEEFTVAKK